MAALSARRLVCSAIPRITSRTLEMSWAFSARPPTSAEVLSTSSLIRRIAWTVSSTRWRPFCADCSEADEASEVELALRATSSTAAVISLTAVAAIWISSFCWVSERLPCSVTALSSSAAEASWVAELPICWMVWRSCACMPWRATSSLAGSSRPEVSMRLVRSPEAITSATRSASPIGWVMLRVNSQASTTVARPATSSTPITAAKALS
ncbi:hypothetical protein PAERUG_P45_London_17_VIM_2_12_12_05429 [Pseudomonas aeruginosa]|nr:hypothetical protein PAERUG_P45_London_17_VIM_2_12_12_05429 [Pseudomonas aeruginosa]